MSIKVYDPKNKEEIEVMEYKYPVTEEFKEFADIKSYSERYDSERVNGETKEIKSINFKTFNHFEITMYDGQYVTRTNNGKYGVLTFEALKELMNKKEETTVTDKDYKTAEVEAQKEQNKQSFEDFLIERNMEAQYNFLRIAKDNLEAIIHSIGSYGMFGTDDGLYKEIMEVFDHCDKIEDFINDKMAELKDAEEEEEDIPNPELYSDKPFDDPIISVNPETGEFVKYNNAREIAEKGFWPEEVIKYANQNKQKVNNQ